MVVVGEGADAEDEGETYLPAAQSLQAQQRIALNRHTDGEPLSVSCGAIFNDADSRPARRWRASTACSVTPSRQRADSDAAAKLKTRIRAFILRRGRDQVLGEHCRRRPIHPLDRAGAGAGVFTKRCARRCTRHPPRHREKGCGKAPCTFSTRAAQTAPGLLRPARVKLGHCPRGR